MVISNGIAVSPQIDFRMINNNNNNIDLPASPAILCKQKTKLEFSQYFRPYFPIQAVAV